jgi:hypothetical protein
MDTSDLRAAAASTNALKFPQKRWLKAVDAQIVQADGQYALLPCRWELIGLARS